MPVCLCVRVRRLPTFLHARCARGVHRRLYMHAISMLFIHASGVYRHFPRAHASPLRTRVIRSLRRMMTSCSLKAMMNRRRRGADEVPLPKTLFLSRRCPPLVPSRAVPWRWGMKRPGTIFFALLICFNNIVSPGLLQTGCIIHWAEPGAMPTMTVPVLSRNGSHITRAKRLSQRHTLWR